MRYKYLRMGCWPVAVTGVFFLRLSLPSDNRTFFVFSSQATTDVSDNAERNAANILYE